MAPAFLAPPGAVAAAFTEPGPFRLVAVSGERLFEEQVIGGAEVGGSTPAAPGTVACRVAVSPQHRGRGIGRALAGAVLLYLAMAGVQRLTARAN